jgi:hypothetical protein
MLILNPMEYSSHSKLKQRVSKDNPINHSVLAIRNSCGKILNRFNKKSRIVQINMNIYEIIRKSLSKAMIKKVNFLCFHTTVSGR